MKAILPLLLLFTSTCLFAQFDKSQRCAQEEWLLQTEESNPGYIENIRKGMEAFNNKKISQKRSSQLIVIPVHVIIVHPPGQAIGTGSNHSLAHVQSQIDVLNQDFGHYNSDAGNTPPQFPAADTGIQFCLATVDPDGNATDGITRYPFSGDFHANSSAIRNETRWPRETYSNIWSAPNLPYLGLASVPSTSNLPSANNDFIHVDAATFGGPGYGTFPNYDLGRTTTHEMGHYLGLFHIWASSGCGSSDGIADTPNQDDENFGCPSHPSPSCGNSGDMFMNYMDYVNDNCMNAFTTGQGQYMNTILTTSRASLLGAASFACVTVIPLTLTVVSKDDPSCSDINDGFILVAASGGSPGYSYSINGSSPSGTDLFTDLPGGSHFIEVFDADGNTTSLTVFLSTPVPLTGSVIVNATNFCPNDKDGSITIQVSGGTNPYNFSLNMGPLKTSPTFSNLSNGFYTYKISDENGCVFEDVFELSGANDIVISIDSVAGITCYGDTTGHINSSAVGGEGPIMFSIDGLNYQEDSTFIDLMGGNYYVYAKDSIGCYDSVAVVLTQPDSFYAVVETMDFTCFGSNDGSASVTIFGGNGAPYLYSLDTNTYETDTILDSLVAGEYTLVVMDSLECPTSTDFEIVEPEAITISIDTIIDIACYGDTNGSAVVSVSGGNGDYTYVLDGDTTDMATYDNLGAGTYELEVFDTNGCFGSISFEILDNSVIDISVVDVEMPSCFENLDGSFNIEANNTEGAVTYSLNNGAPQMSSLFTNLTAGEYLIIAEDETGCKSAITYDLGQPDLMILALQVQQNVSCNGLADGEIIITISGGTPLYFYMYEGTGTNPDGLAAGDYSMTVTDSNGCAVVEAFQITEPDAISLNSQIVAEVNCDSDTEGSLSVTATGGTGAFDYLLTGPSGTASKDNGEFDDLTYGPHVVTVTDENGCTAEVLLNMPYENAFFAELISVEDILCFGGNGGGVLIDVQGGMGEITYELDDNGEVDPENLDTQAGDHTISIIDDNGCRIDLLFTLEEPTQLSLEPAYNFGAATVTINASGGIVPYMYSFDGGATFSDDNVYEGIDGTVLEVVVKDANGCEIAQSVGTTKTTEIENDWAVIVYPNPFTDVLNLKLDLANDLVASIEIFDLAGRRLHIISSQKYNTGENFVNLDLSNFVSSIYIIKIASAESYRYIKVTKL